MKKVVDKAKWELKTLLDFPIAYTAIAVLIAHFTTNELIQLTIFFLILVIILIKKHDTCIPITFTLILFMLCAFQRAFQTETAANNTAILAYYLLCVGVIAQVIEYIKNPEDEPVEDEKEIMPDIPKDTGSGSISSALKEIIFIIKNTHEKLVGLVKKSISGRNEETSNNRIRDDIYSANHDYSYKPKQYGEIDKKMEDVRKRTIERNGKR